MFFYSALLYGIPIMVILVTLYIGYRGIRFYIDEIVRK
jgi:hypothetical protein